MPSPTARRTVPGSPPSSPARSVLINLRVTPAEREAMRARCKALGVTMSEAVRALLCPPLGKGGRP